MHCVMKMCKTKIYMSVHLFWLVWLGKVPHNKPMFNAWTWSLACQCSCPSVWRAWSPFHVAEALGITLGTERFVWADHTGLLGCICSSGSPTAVFAGCASTAATCLVFTLRLWKAWAKENQQGARRDLESKTEACGYWLLWARLLGAQLSELNPEALSSIAPVLYQAWRRGWLWREVTADSAELSHQRGLWH